MTRLAVTTPSPAAAAAAAAVIVHLIQPIGLFVHLCVVG